MMYSVLQLCLVSLAGQALALPRSNAGALTARDNCPAFDPYILGVGYNCNEVVGQKCYYCCDNAHADAIDQDMEEPYDECHSHSEPSCGEFQAAIHCEVH